MSKSQPFCGAAALWVCLVLLPLETHSAPRNPQQSAASTAASPQAAQLLPSTIPGVEILSDLNGVNVVPYLQSSLNTIKRTWYGLIPASAQGSKMMRGNVCIQLSIAKTGKIRGMKLVSSSGDTSLDHAAWLGISDSRLSPLPKEFAGQYLALRLDFSYNAERPSDLVLQYRAIRD